MLSLRIVRVLRRLLAASALALASLVASTAAASAALVDATVYGWGLNHVGQLGLGNTTSFSVPTPGTSTPFDEIVAGLRFACGLTPDGTAFCWGENTAGQLGNGTTTPSLIPQEVSGGHSFVALTAGAAHACGVTPTDSIFCWGLNADGQLGIGNNIDQSTPSLVPNSYTKVAAGIENTCALNSSGQAYCWGVGDYFGAPAALGNGTLTATNLPSAVTMPAGRSFEDIGVGWFSACALDDLGAAWCWGINGQGQLGTGDTTSRLVPSAVTGGLTFSSVSVGGSHRCGIALSGSTYCWGANINGQLGLGSTTDQSAPQPVVAGDDFLSLAAYSSYTCALDDGGLAYCWGDNLEGQLGQGTRGIVAQPLPRPVLGDQRFSRLAEGSRAGQFVLALPLRAASGDNVPTAPLQQFVRSESDTCERQPTTLVDFPALTDQVDRAWGMSWAQWPNGGTGGYVCSRQPFYTSLGTWSVQ